MLCGELFSALVLCHELNKEAESQNSSIGLWPVQHLEWEHFCLFEFTPRFTRTSFNLLCFSCQKKYGPPREMAIQAYLGRRGMANNVKAQIHRYQNFVTDGLETR